MSRVYSIRDARGERQFGAQDLPISIGGAGQDGILLPGLPDDAVVAHIGLAEGHAFIQPTQTGMQMFHNHQHLSESRWLKSGDLVEVAESAIDWRVQGDQVEIRVRERQAVTAMVPPASPPPLIQRPLPEVVVSGPPPARQRTWRWLALAAFLVLLLAVAFVLLATPVTIKISPQPQSRSLAGFPPAISIGGRQLVMPGRYRLSARHEGYRPLEQDIEVRSGGLQVFEFELEELPGRVGISLQPDVPFRLFVDGSAIEIDAEGLAEIPGGTRTLRIETERYLPVEATLQVFGKGKSQRLSHVLEPAWANVRIDSQPGGATVLVDGERLGVTPLDTELLQGGHDLVLALEKYKQISVRQEIKAGTDQVLDSFRLQPLDGRLTISSEPAEAIVTLNGVFQGTTPLSLVLTSGVEHRLRLAKPGYEDLDEMVQLAADGEESLEARLKPQYGIVFVTARPADAGLRVDGRDVGKATRRLRLPTRSHTLVFSKPGYASRSVTVTPRAGSSQNVEVTLVTAKQAEKARQAAATPATTRTSAGQGLRLVRPQGILRMGASRREAGRRANESVRQVQLVRPFYMGAREVSNAEYRRFKPAHDSGSADGGSLNLDSQPVVNVSWDDAARYCNWLSQREGLPPAYTEVDGRMRAVTPTGRGYRLPGEAEWAYVARKYTRQSEQRYPWEGGFPPTSVVGNFADASIADTLANTVPDYNDGHRVAAPVASFAARPEGFHDLGGNVAEWVHDYYAVYPGEAGSVVKDPLGPKNGDHHVVRDSSWRQGTITELRLSYRDYSRVARPDLGFRVARYANQ
ncbi:MAG: PEGA domain-containing protein [Sedimenticolaceae bacterium]